MLPEDCCDAAGFQPRGHPPERLYHLRPKVSDEELQDILDLCSQRQQFRREQFIERVDINFGAAEFGWR